MADQTTSTAPPTVPTWLKWTIGLAAVGAAAFVGIPFVMDAVRAAGEEAPAGAPKKNGTEVLVIGLRQREPKGDWWVTSSIYRRLDVESTPTVLLSEHNEGPFDSKEEAFRDARSAAKAARASSAFKTVRTLLSQADWKRHEERQRRSAGRLKKAAA